MTVAIIAIELIICVPLLYAALTYSNTFYCGAMSALACSVIVRTIDGLVWP